MSKRREIIDLATKDVITTVPTTTIKALCDLMMKTGKRKIPIIDPMHLLKGMVTSTDLINYFGGGSKYLIMEKDYQGNFLSGINAPTSKVMTECYDQESHHNNAGNCHKGCIQNNVRKPAKKASCCQRAPDCGDGSLI
ncbi:MAG: CBS domain-containing protein [Candidatus Micrarchaeota archaeon]|nr:CBS domain-containing protein [Candidatus Micrarchaeota archaeon]